MLMKVTQQGSWLQGPLSSLWDLKVTSSQQPVQFKALCHSATGKWIVPGIWISLEANSFLVKPMVENIAQLLCEILSWVPTKAVQGLLNHNETETLCCSKPPSLCYGNCEVIGNQYTCIHNNYVCVCVCVYVFVSMLKYNLWEVIVFISLFSYHCLVIVFISLFHIFLDNQWCKWV